MTPKELAKQYPGDRAVRLQLWACSCCDRWFSVAVIRVPHAAGPDVYLCPRCLREYASACAALAKEVTP